MEQEVYFKYINTQLNIGVFDLKNVYSLRPQLQKMLPEVYKGRLVYRLKGSSKRISYQSIKKGLQRKSFHLFITIPF
jgi:hypothetical protein